LVAMGVVLPRVGGWRRGVVVVVGMGGWVRVCFLPLGLGLWAVCFPQCAAGRNISPK